MWPISTRVNRPENDDPSILVRSLWIGRLPWNRQTSEGPQEGFDSSGKASNASLRSSCGSVTPSEASSMSFWLRALLSSAIRALLAPAS